MSRTSTGVNAAVAAHRSTTLPSGLPDAIFSQRRAAMFMPVRAA